MKNVIDFAGGGGEDGGGAGGRNLERRVDCIEMKLDWRDEALRRIEDALRSMAEDNKAFAQSIVDLRENLAHNDGRPTNIPTTRQILALFATLLVGLSGIIFTASRLFHP